MALKNVRPLFRERMEILGFKEHKDAFNTDNIASTVLDDSFHIATGAISTQASNQFHHSFEYPVTVRIFKKGFRDPANMLDQVDEIVETIYTDILKPDVRLGADIKDIAPQGYQPVEFDVSNDNIIVIEMDFIVKVIMCFT